MSKRKKCTECNKKFLKMNLLDCRCGKKFCINDLTNHKCDFDYRATHKKHIKKHNEVVKGEKLNKL